MDGNDQLDLDLDSEHNEVDLESDLLMELALQRNFSDPQLFQKLENTNLLRCSPPLEFFKLFITDDFVTKMAEQTTSMLFKKAHHDHSSQYLMGT